MPFASARRVARVLLTAASLLFAALGLVPIPLAGIQDDEALFAHPLFMPAFAPYTLAIFHHHLPLYWPILRIFGSNAYSLWFPMVFAGVLTILLFCDFAKKIAGIHAIYPLAEDLRTATAEHAGEHIYVMDWGVTETLTFLGRGKLPLFAGANPFFTATPDLQQQLFTSKMFTDPQGLFVGHIREREVFTGVGERFVATAAASGYRKDIVRTIFDSSNRAVFEIFRVRSAHSDNRE